MPVGPISFLEPRRIYDVAWTKSPKTWGPKTSARSGHGFVGFFRWVFLVLLSADFGAHYPPGN